MFDLTTSVKDGSEGRDLDMFSLVRALIVTWKQQTSSTSASGFKKVKA
jgi:hypothetical protein